MSNKYNLYPHLFFMAGTDQTNAFGRYSDL
jgi:hypothetical protein